MTLAELEKAKAESVAEIAAAVDAAAVEALRVRYIGRNGSIPALIKAMKDVPKEERPAFGKAVQAWRAEVEAALAAKGGAAGGEKPVEADLTLPGRWWERQLCQDIPNGTTSNVKKKKPTAKKPRSLPKWAVRSR